MDFDLIKAYYALKASKKQKQEQQYYVLEETQQKGVRFLLQKKLLELMLVEDWELPGLINCEFIEREGWHEEDGVVCERYKLNDKGRFLYDNANVGRQAPKYLKALDCINNNKPCDRFEEQKFEILFQYKRYAIDKIYKYEPKENKDETQQVSHL